MDPLEVGEKTLARHDREPRPHPQHPEHGDDFEDIHRASMHAALPDEEAPAGQVLKQLRRDADGGRPSAGLLIRLDLT